MGARGLRLQGGARAVVRRHLPSNAVKSGLAPIAVDTDAIRAAVEQKNELVVDLEALEIRHPQGLVVPFTLDPYDQETLVGGLDDIARTLIREDEIARYEASHPGRFDLKLIALRG